MKWLNNRLLLCSMILLVYTSAFGQEQRHIHGKVYQESINGKKELLAGANIGVLGDTVGTFTEQDGSFSLMVPVNYTKLVVSYIGYTPDTIILSNNNTLDVVLQQPRTLKEVVIARHQKTNEVSMLKPMKVEQIGKQELFKAACCNLSESFETTPSVDVAYTDAISGYKQVMMLGLAGPYTLITRENIPDIRGLAAITGLTFTPGIWIESMQLSKGTGSVVNGYESVAGQINIELEKPFKGETWLFNLYQNSQGRSELNINYRHKLNNRLSTNLFVNVSKEWMKTDQNKDGFLDQPLGNRFTGISRWFYAAPKDWEIQWGVKGIYVANTGGQWGYDKNIEQVAGNPWGYQLNTNRVEGWAKIGKVFDDRPGTSIGLQLSDVYHNQQAQYGGIKYNATQKSMYANLIFQTIIHNTNNVIKGGLSNIIDQYDETFEQQSYKRNEIVPGVFAEYSYSYLEKLNIVAGLRGDYDNLYGGFITPRLHIRYAPFRQTAIRASIGRAQRTANIFAENMGLMASNRQFVIVNSTGDKAYGLDPEVAWNMGLNLTQKFRFNYREGTVSADYYYTDFQNQVVTDIEDPHYVRFYNLNGRSFANSLQFQLDYELIHNLNLRLAYRWYDVKTTYNGTLKEKPLVAANRAFANVAYETRNHWKFDYTVQWVGTKRVPASYDNAEGLSPSFIQMNAQITKTINNNLDVYVGGENLTNYMQPNPIIGADNPFGQNFDASLIWGPVMGRNIYAGVRYKIK